MTPSGNEKEIDVQIVRNHVDKLLKQMSLKNTEVGVASGSLNGDNYLGLISKVSVRGEDATGKTVNLNLIVKCATTNEGFRDAMNVEHAYEREAYVYNKVFPTFREFQEERGTESPFNSYATCYYTSLQRLNEALIFENMKEINYQLADRKKTLDFDHVLLVVREYGKFHAVSFALKDQKPKVFEELKSQMEVNFNDKFSDETTFKFFDVVNGYVMNSLDPVEDSIAFERYRQFTEMARQFKEMTGQFTEMYRPYSEDFFKKDEYCCTFIHGDCWMNNMLFRYEDHKMPNYPTNLCLLDFQLSAIASPVIDLTYFLFCNVGSDILQKHYDFFLDEYYKSLSNAIKELGSDPDKLYPKEIFQLHLQNWAFQGLCSAVMVIKLMVSDSEEIPDVNKCTNMDDMMGVYTAQTKRVSHYNKRIRDLVLHCMKYDYIPLK